MLATLRLRSPEGGLSHVARADNLEVFCCPAKTDARPLDTRLLHQQPQEFFCNFRGEVSKIGNHGDGIGAGIDHRPRVGARDAADGDQRLLGRGARGANTFEPDDGDQGSAWRRSRRPGRKRCSPPDSRRPSSTARDCASKRRGCAPARRPSRAPSGERSSWPTCTPSKSAARQRSARSFMMSVTVLSSARRISRAWLSMLRASAHLCCDIE